jgi:hypothetical protein
MDRESEKEEIEIKDCLYKLDAKSHRQREGRIALSSNLRVFTETEQEHQDVGQVQEKKNTTQPPRNARTPLKLSPTWDGLQSDTASPTETTNLSQPSKREKQNMELHEIRNRNALSDSETTDGTREESEKADMKSQAVVSILSRDALATRLRMVREQWFQWVQGSN